jgi:hypothetical protein
MSFLYFILAVTGWVWAAIVGAYLVYRLGRKEPAGFDVVQKHHEKLP